MMRPQNLIGSIAPSSRSNSPMLVRSPSFEQSRVPRIRARRRGDEQRQRPLIREHFGLDDPSAKRGKRLGRRFCSRSRSARAPTAPSHSGRRGARTAAQLLAHPRRYRGRRRDAPRPADALDASRRAAALVAGDAMSALAYLTLVDGSRALPPPTVAAMMRCLQEAHFRMCEGQAFDIGFETPRS